MVVPAFVVAYFGFKSLGYGTTVNTSRNVIENINMEEQEAYINNQKTIVMLVTVLVIIKAAKLIIYVIRTCKQYTKKEVELRGTQYIQKAAPQQQHFS